jgi:hypothetical protein
MSSSKKGKKKISESGEGKTFGSLSDLQDGDSGPEGGDGPEAGGSPEAGTSAEDAGSADSGGDDGRASDTIRMTFHISRQTAERLRNAVYFTGAFVTLSGTARKWLQKAVEALEDEYNDGEPFPDRREHDKGGGHLTEDGNLVGGNPDLEK